MSSPLSSSPWPDSAGILGRKASHDRSDDHGGDAEDGTCDEVPARIAPLAIDEDLEHKLGQILKPAGVLGKILGLLAREPVRTIIVPWRLGAHPYVAVFFVSRPISMMSSQESNHI